MENDHLSIEVAPAKRINAWWESTARFHQDETIPLHYVEYLFINVFGQYADQYGIASVNATPRADNPYAADSVVVAYNNYEAIRDVGKIMAETMGREKFTNHMTVDQN